MRIDVAFTPSEIDDSRVRDRIIVVVDVLRASTTITTALNNGAREVIPVLDVETALKMRTNLSAELTLLCGERNGRIIDGFDLGNSPSEYVSERITGKVLVFSTTNGTLAAAKARGSREMVIGSFVNLSRVVEYLSGRGDGDATILCSGKQNTFSLEDAVCAGMIINRLCELKPPVLTDGARAAQGLYKRFGRSLLSLLNSCDHGKYLASIGFARDLESCAAVDSVPILPVLVDNTVLKILQPQPPTGGGAADEERTGVKSSA